MPFSKLRSTLAVGVVLSFAGAACTLLADHSATQCAADGDCRRFGADAVCVASTCQRGTPVGGDSGSEAGDSGRDAADAGPTTPPGCVRGTPSQPSDFLNACTDSTYLGFDNCARIGLCNADAEAPLADPPVLDASTSPPQDGGSLPGCYATATATGASAIYMQGSTNFTPFVQAMAPLVAKSNFRMVWQATTSCAGAAVGFAGSVTTGNPSNLMKNPTTGAFASAYDDTGKGTPCLLGDSPSGMPGVSDVADLGESDVFADTCNGAWTLAASTDTGHYTGPIQPMTFVVPPSSSQRVISAEAARLVFGGGGAGGVATPWTDPTYMFIRSSSTGTNNILSLGMGISPKKWWGVDKKNAGNLTAAITVADPGTSEKTIGVLSMDFANSNKQNLHILYFQARGQVAGFLPDRQPASSDKQNVRDGHYPLWGPIHLYAKVNGGTPSASASAFINQFAVPKPDQALLDATIATGNVPVCAMKVTRSAEMGPLATFTPGFGCGCYFDFKVNGGNSCTKCAGSVDCPASRPTCNLGYCEVQ